jgi:hypothetical protein
VTREDCRPDRNSRASSPGQIGLHQLGVENYAMPTKAMQVTRNLGC